MPSFTSDKQRKKDKKKFLKELGIEYKIYRNTWETFDYFHLYFHERIATKMGWTKEQFDNFKKNTVIMLSELSKIVQEYIKEVKFESLKDFINTRIDTSPSSMSAPNTIMQMALTAPAVPPVPLHSIEPKQQPTMPNPAPRQV